MPGFLSKHVRFVMQNLALGPYLTATENIMIALNVKNNNKPEYRKRALKSKVDNALLINSF